MNEFGAESAQVKIAWTAQFIETLNQLKIVEIENGVEDDNVNPESAREPTLYKFTRILEPLLDFAQDTVDSND